MTSRFFSGRSTTSQFNCAAVHIWADGHSALELGGSAAQLARATTASSGPHDLTIVYPAEPISADNAETSRAILQICFSLYAGMLLDRHVAC
jgi:hypothetical protein